MINLSLSLQKDSFISENRNASPTHLMFLKKHCFSDLNSWNTGRRQYMHTCSYAHTCVFTTGTRLLEMRRFDALYYLQTHYDWRKKKKGMGTLKTLRDIQTSRGDCQPAGHFITQATHNFNYCLHIICVF